MWTEIPFGAVNGWEWTDIKSTNRKRETEIAFYSSINSLVR